MGTTYAGGKSFGISAMSGAGVTIQVTTSTPHGLSTGQAVYISGVAGNLAANGYWPSITVTGSSIFTLDHSTGSASYTSGGTVYVDAFNSTTVLSDGDNLDAAHIGTPDESAMDRTAWLYRRIGGLTLVNFYAEQSLSGGNVTSATPAALVSPTTVVYATPNDVLMGWYSGQVNVHRTASSGSISGEIRARYALNGGSYLTLTGVDQFFVQPDDTAAVSDPGPAAPFHQSFYIAVGTNAGKYQFALYGQSQDSNVKTSVNHPNFYLAHLRPVA